jgi:hypothetical protein
MGLEPPLICQDENISFLGNVNCKLMYSQSLTVTKQLPELEASFEVSFGDLNFELSTVIAASRS